MFRKVCNIIADNMELLTKRRDSLTPPKRMIFVGDTDYRKTGEEFLEYFIRYCNLKPDERVLDIGCGIGRMAVPLAKYMNRRASYEGFDVVKKGIDWCRRNISSRYPNFNFTMADIYNKNYNPRGTGTAARYRFGYNNESFDFALAASVFTHMLPGDMENYISEMRRVLKRGGRSLATFFLLNDESASSIESGKISLNFKYDFNTYRTIDRDKPEAALCYDEKFISELYERYGLKIRRPISYGSWCGRADFLSLQDIVIADKVN